MKYAVYFVLILLLTFSEEISFAQTAPAIEWQKCLGGSKDEDGVGGNQNSIIQTSDNGFAIVGSTHSVDGDVVGFHGGANEDIWLVKLNSVGNIQWQKCLGGAGAVWPTGIIQTPDKGYAISGYAEHNGGDVSENHGGGDAWLIKLDSVGIVEWQKCIGGTALDYSTSILKISGGGYLISGYTESSDEGLFNHGNGDAFLAKVNSMGGLVWQKCYGGSQYDLASSVIESSDGGYVFSSVTKSNDGNVKGHRGDSTKKNMDVWIVKLDTSGNVIWQKCLGGSRDDGSSSIVQSCDKGYIVCGYTISTDGDVSGLHGDTTKKNRASDVWVEKIDSLGAFEWQKCLGGSLIEGGSSMIRSNDCGYVITGLTNSNDGDVSGLHGDTLLTNRQYDVWVVKLSSLGNLEWQKCLGGSGYEEGFAITQTNDGGYVIDGRTNSINTGDIEGIHVGGDSAHRTSDIWVVKLRATSGVETQTNPYLGFANSFYIYPNPSSDKVHLKMWGNQTVRSVEFYDVLGNKHNPAYELSGNSSVVNVKSLPDGLYLSRLTFIYNDYTGTFTLPLIVRH